jgi:hypothetical protein
MIQFVRPTLDTETLTTEQLKELEKRYRDAMASPAGKS